MGYLYLNLNVKVLKLIAMYNMDHKGAAFRAFYSFWRFLAAGSIFIVSIQSLLDILLRDSTEFLDISSQILNFGIHTCAVVRLVYFYAFSKSVNDLVTGMNRDFKYKSLGVFEEKTMEGHVGISVKLCKFWIFNVVFTTQTINLFSWISTVLFGKPRSLGIPLWYPWDWKKSPYFELSVLGRTFTNFFLSFAYGNVDNFFVSAVFLTAGQFAILGSDLKNVIYNSLVKFGISRREVSDFRNDFLEGRLDVEGKRYPGISSALKTAEFQNFLKENFKDVVEHHRKLVAYCGALEDFFSPILLPLLGFGVFYVIFIAFVAATTDDKTIFFSLTIYFMSASVQITCLNFFGQMITTASENLISDLYEMPWYICNPSFISMLKIVQMRLQTPITLSVGKILIMSLNTFLGIYRTSFSYYAVLRRLTARE